VLVAALLVLLYFRCREQTNDEPSQNEFETVPELAEMSDGSGDQGSATFGDSEFSFLTTFSFEGTEEAIIDY
jgi:hypothetical protein